MAEAKREFGFVSCFFLVFFPKKKREGGKWVHFFKLS